MTELRPYQLDAINQIRAHFSKGGKRCLLRLPTGAGKSVVMGEILTSLYAKGGTALLVVKGKKLVDQMSQRLTRLGVPHGVIMANDKRQALEHKIQVASVDSLYARRFSPEADLLLIDEVHTARSPAFDWLFSKYPEAFFIGVTATPFHARGFTDIAEVLIEPTTVKELIDQGFLVPGKYFAPTEFDTSHIKRHKDDFVTKDLNRAVNQSRLFGPIIGSWIKYGNNKPTLLFCVSVSHSLRLVKAFREEGIAARHIDAKSSEAEREEAIEQLRTGRIKILSSVTLLVTGIDIPEVETLIVARPTLSITVHQQMLGRGSRPFPGKKFFTVLDHANNVQRHNFYEVHRHATLDGKNSLYRVIVKTCQSCFFCWDGVSQSCPGLLSSGEICGWTPPPPKPKLSDIRSNEAVELEEIRVGEDMEERERRLFVRQTIDYAVERGMAKGYAFYKIKSRYGDEVARQSWRLIHEAYGT